MRHSLLLVSLLCLAIPAAAAELQPPTVPGPSQYVEQNAEGTVVGQTAWLLRSKQFEAVNAMAERYRTGAERSPSGVPLLSYFYEGVKAYATPQTPSPAARASAAQWNPVIDMAKEWIARSPSPAAHIALAKFYVEWAYEIRGFSYAKDVPADAWSQFYAKLAEAHRVLDASKKIASIDPEWYRLMVILARSEQTDSKTIEPLFTEALAKHKYYDPLYLAIADAVHPNWGGSWELLDAFARFAAKNTADKFGNTLYARIYWTAGNCDCFRISDTKADWGFLKDSFKELVQRYPTQWNIGSFAYFACMAEDKQVARSELSQMTEYSGQVWQEHHDFYDQCRKWAAES